MSRRSFLGKSLAVGAGTMGVGLMAETARASGDITQGDIAILRWLAAAEIIETDLWQQYNELGGIQDSEVPGGSGNEAFTEALEVLDEDMPVYVHDNTDDEISHVAFLNGFLTSIGAQPVNFDAFRTLPSSQASGAQKIGRLTNLMRNNIDTSWYLRYRSAHNPDFNFVFPQFINISNRPAIPPTDLPSGSDEIQAIANTAAFHFAAIEQGGSSLYTALALRVTNVTVLRIVVSIGGAEVNHFAIWHDKAGNAPEVTIPGPGGVSFPDLEDFEGNESRQNNLIMPEPCTFIDPALPVCAVIRPSLIPNAGAVHALHAFAGSGAFLGQSQAFLNILSDLASRADAAQRQL
ncbi:MAG TPA: ferritin-like domain-containing protein [Candidatus Udaeobacter sp.]|nr:ferritin-like domain-containing protein [Candidatus Udaeobacter sp.]